MGAFPHFTEQNARTIGATGGAARKGHKAAHTLQAMEIRKNLIQRFMDEADLWYEAMRELALGHHVEIKDPRTGRLLRVYRKSPELAAIQEMFNRTFGRVPLPIEVNDSPTEAPLSDLAESLLQPYVDGHDKRIGIRALAGVLGSRPEERAESVGATLARAKKKPAHLRPVLLPAHRPDGPAAVSPGPDPGADVAH